MHIVFCCDRRVLPGLHVAAYSLLDRFDISHSKPEITIFSDALDDADVAQLHQTLETLAKPFTLTLHRIDTERFSSFPPLNNSWATYYRLYAFETIEAERALYIDADTLCDIDVSPLQYFEMGSHPVAWVPEAPLNDAVDQDVAEQLDGNELDSYFNAGVILVDVNEWQKQNISQRAMEYIAKYQPMFHDQSALNVLLHHNATKLDAKFNCMSNMRNNWHYLKSSYGEVNRLIHFLDYPKPWDFMAEWIHPQYELWYSVLRHTTFKEFKSWHTNSCQRTVDFNKFREGLQKAAKDRLLFSLYSRNMFKSVIKGA